MHRTKASLQKGHLRTGRIGEVKAIRYLRQHGYTIINQNVEFGKNELDIVAEKDGMIVFVEVKTNEKGDTFLPSLRVDHRKLGTLKRMAQIWIDRRSESMKCDIPACIDVIGVIDGEVVEHYQDVTG